MAGRIVAVGMMLAVLSIAAGCVSPVIGNPEPGGRSALEQMAIASAAKEALKKPKIEALRGMKVWVDVTSISRARMGGTESEDERFLQGMIVEHLVENSVVVVEKANAQAVLRAVVEAIGSDTVARVWPHAYLPLMYYIYHKAHVKIHLYAYDMKDSQPLAVDDCEGTYSWTEWSFLGLGPFR